MIEYTKGDLIELAKDGNFDVIIHQCNCFNTFGSGIARQIKINFPSAYIADLQTLQGDIDKLGTFTSANINDLVICNAYGQYRYGRNKQYTDYDALKKALTAIYSTYGNVRYGMPKIGCGLAGGDWNIVEKIINEVFICADVTIVDFIA